MAQAPADLIRAMQPYKREELDRTLIAAEDPLWILFKLDVIDKHRMVLATNEQVRPETVIVTMPGHEPKEYAIQNGQWQPFKAGTPLFRFTMPADHELHPEVRLNLDLTLLVRFAETGLWCDGKPVIELAAKTHLVHRGHRH